MNLIPLGLNVDGSLSLQAELSARLSETVNLREREKDLRLWANRRGLAVLRETIQWLRKKYPQPCLFFLGSGDLHYLTLLLLASLPADFQPVNLVLIDNHPDWFTHLPRHHCGNWVSGALWLSWLKTATLVCQNSDDLKGSRFWFVPFRDLCSGRVRLHPYKRTQTHVPLRWPKNVRTPAATFSRHFYGTKIQFRTVQENGALKFFETLSTQLAGEKVYLSIDKDCLREMDAATDWDQGCLSLDELLTGIEQLKAKCQIIGADVCGERAPSPLRGFLKRVDAGRLSSGMKHDPTADRLNEKTNLAILKALSA